ncbi:MAG TPA: Uma2 family endonuclease [Gemmataceae bacterium]|nr:Uma2 family endonuclease [Gemmataceae bacterium]
MTSHSLEEQDGAVEHAEATPEQLLEMEDGDRFELIDGQLVERNLGAMSSQVALNALGLLREYVHPKKLGKLFGTDCGYQIFPDKPNQVRYPDGSFIARGRLSEDRTPGGHVPIPPDLAIEAVSPNDTAEEVETKRLAFLRAGVRLLWVIYPENRTVHVYRKEGGAAALGEGDELSGEDVLPGFVCKVADLFADL